MRPADVYAKHALTRTPCPAYIGLIPKPDIVQYSPVVWFCGCDMATLTMASTNTLLDGSTGGMLVGGYLYPTYVSIRVYSAIAYERPA